MSVPAAPRRRRRRQMASLQAKHTKKCVENSRHGVWTTFEKAREECTCKGGPTYHVIVREGKKSHPIRAGKDRQTAERKLRKIQTQIDEGTFVFARRAGLRDYGDEWLDKISVKDGTRLVYRSSINRFVEYLGKEAQVRRINTRNVTGFLGWLRKEKGVTESTVHRHLTTLETFFEAAIADGVATGNPARGVPASVRPRKKEKEAAYFEDEELRKLLAVLAEDPASIIRFAFLILLYTGLRLGELIALRWSDIDLKYGELHVRESLSDKEDEPGEPKDRQKREVDLFPEAVATFRELKEQLGDVAADDLVVAGEVGAYWRVASYARSSTN